MPEIRAWKDRLAKVGKAREKVEEKGEGEVPDIPGDGIGWQDREMDVSEYSTCCHDFVSLI